MTFNSIICDGLQTLSQICFEYNCDINMLINSNTQLINYYDISIEDQESQHLFDYATTREYLQECNLSNRALVRGLEIRLPEKSTGGVSSNSYYYDSRSQEILARTSRYVPSDNRTEYEFPQEVTGSFSEEGVWFPSSSLVGSDRILAPNYVSPNPSDQNYYADLSKYAQEEREEWSVKSDNSTSYAYRQGYGYSGVNAILMPNYQSEEYQKKFNCKYWIYRGRKANRAFRSKYLPVYPNEVLVNTQGKFTPLSVLGRSVDYQIYNGTERSISLMLTLHAELYQSAAYLSTTTINESLKTEVALIESASYPYYDTDGAVSPPEFALQIGSQLYVRGILSSCSARWSAPIIDNGLVNCELSLSITETNGPYSAEEVQRMKGCHGSPSDMED